MPSTNTPWYLHRRGRDAGWLAAGQGGTEGVGVQDGTPPPTCQVALGDGSSGSACGSLSWAPSQRASPGTAQEGPCAQHQRIQTWGRRQWGASLGKGCPRTLWREDARDRKAAGLSLHRDKGGSELRYHRLPSQPRHIPRTPARRQRREHSGRLAGSRKSHEDSSGKLLLAGCSCQPQPACPSISREPVACAPAPGPAPVPSLHRVLLS